jgi:hypothetical protein
MINILRSAKIALLFDRVSFQNIHHLRDLYYVPENAPFTWSDFSTAGALLSTYQTIPPPRVLVHMHPRLPSEYSITFPIISSRHKDGSMSSLLLEL